MHGSVLAGSGVKVMVGCGVDVAYGEQMASRMGATSTVISYSVSTSVVIAMGLKGSVAWKDGLARCRL